MASTAAEAARNARAEQKITQHLLEVHANELMMVQTLTAHIAMTPVGRYRSKLEAHLRQTREQAQRIQDHLVERESEPGLVQAGYGVAQGVVSQVVAASKVPIDLVRGMSGEEKLLKNCRDECAGEAMEIAAYLALEQLARRVGDADTERLAASIRKQEEQMLERLLEEIPKLAADVVAAEVEGKPQFQVLRMGAVDAARSVAGSAARTVARSASRVARRVEVEAGNGNRAGGRSAEGTATVRAAEGRRSGTARRTPAKRDSTPRASTSKARTRTKTPARS